MKRWRQATYVLAVLISTARAALSQTGDAPALAATDVRAELYYHVGKKVTTNVLLHFYKLEQWSGGNIPPVNGIELAMFLSW
jgi:hypothetical protein